MPIAINAPCVYAMGMGRLASRDQAIWRELLQRWLSAHQTTQEALAAKLGIHQGTVSRWVKGKLPIPAWLSFALRGISAREWEAEFFADTVERLAKDIEEERNRKTRITKREDRDT